MAEPNYFAAEAILTSFNEGEEWLDKLQVYLDGNRNIAVDFINREIPAIKMIEQDATYLLWLDCGNLSSDSDTLCKFIRQKTGLYLSAGGQNRGNGKTFLRLNIACQREKLVRGLHLLKNGIEAYCRWFETLCGSSFIRLYGCIRDALGERRYLDYVDTERIFLLGKSQGGAVSAITAADLQDEMSGLILLYPALCLMDDAFERYPSIEGVPERVYFMGMTIGRAYYENLYGYNIFDDITRYTGNVLIVHGDCDSIVPPCIRRGRKAVSVSTALCDTGCRTRFRRNVKRNCTGVYQYLFFE